MRRKKIKNTILKGMAALTSLTATISACMVDSRSWIPAIVCFGCIAWLGLFCYANFVWRK